MALMVLKSVAVDILNSGDEAEAIAILNNFLSRWVITYAAEQLPVQDGEYVRS